MVLKKVRDLLPQSPRISDASHSQIPKNMSKESSDMVDLEDRDPKSLSRHLQVSWDDIIGEPLTIRSPECAWTTSNHCFRISRNCCYTCLSVICAPITAFCLGITFACISFQHIWCSTPCLRIWKISCAITRSFLTAFTHGCIIPLTTACGYCCSQIRIRTQKINEDIEKEEEVLLI